MGEAYRWHWKITLRGLATKWKKPPSHILQLKSSSTKKVYQNFMLENSIAQLFKHYNTWDRYSVMLSEEQKVSSLIIMYYYLQIYMFLWVNFLLIFMAYYYFLIFTGFIITFRWMILKLCVCLNRVCTLADSSSLLICLAICLLWNSLLIGPSEHMLL